jgi:hypothetical protein
MLVLGHLWCHYALPVMTIDEIRENFEIKPKHNINMSGKRMLRERAIML